MSYPRLDRVDHSDAGCRVGQQFDPSVFREVMRRVATPVVIVTARTGDGRPAGMTVGSFTSVSLDPMLVTFFIDRSSTTWPTMQHAETFVVNVLASDGGDLCRKFSRKGDRFADVSWLPSPAGDPILTDAAASLQCTPHSTLPLGDHLQVVASVTSADIHHERPPLVYFKSAFLPVAEAAS